jgi:SAM-dependent methyltransferase
MHMSLLDAISLTRKITRPRLAAFLKNYATDKKTLDVGCGTALYGDYFPNRTTLDIVARPGVTVDILADAHDLHMVATASYDVILCTEVLEHLHTPAKAIAEFNRILKPGGMLFLTTRFIFPLHDVPGDYYRYTKYGLMHLLRDFELIDIREEASTIETLAVLYQRIGYQCETLWFRPFKIFWLIRAKFALLFARMITKEFGDVREKVPERNILCSGYYVAARKK